MADTQHIPAPPGPPEAGVDAPAVVDVRGLWTAFGSGRNRVVIHKDLDLTVRRGEILSLVGGSGTGKTVLLRQMLGLESPEQGTVTVLGKPAARLGRRGAASRVGMLFQQGALFSAFNVIDNIAFALRELGTLPVALAREAALVKLQMVGLKPGDALKMPADLSGGMIKRVALARALIMDPPLLLLDEPTAGLDPAGSDAFCELLRGLHAELGLTVVMVTHDLDTLFDLSTRVAVLAEQHVLASGTPAEVAQVDHPFVREYFQGLRGRRAQVVDPPQAAHFVSSPTPPGGRHRSTGGARSTVSLDKTPVANIAGQNMQPGGAGSAVFSRNSGAVVDAPARTSATGNEPD